MPDFHNPYNFIPNPDRSTLEGTVFGDSEPRGHSALSENTYRGVVRVNATAQTPLFVPDAARSSSECLTHRLRGCPANGRDCKRHETLPLRLVRTSPHIPPSSVKGMLRSAYETVTLSRYAAFNLVVPLGYRPSAQNGGAVPFRVSETRSDGSLVLDYFYGTGEDGVDPAAWIPVSDALRIGHRNEVNVSLQLHHYERQLQGNRPPIQFDFFAVVGINGAAIDARIPRDATPYDTDAIDVEGFVHATARERHHPNFPRKHHERFFFAADSESRVRIEYSGEHGIRISERWEQLIADYQSRAQEASGRERNRGQHQSPRNGWNRFGEGTQGYAFQRGDQIFVKPVLISRYLYEHSPLDLAREQEVEPAWQVNRLSTADRVFGWVSQNGAGSDVTSAVKGKASIGPMENLDVQVPGSGAEKTLAILSVPRPSYGRFYTGTAGGARWPNGGTKEQTSYDAAGVYLRGRKVYPHQHSPAYASNVAAATGAKANQNKTMHGWIKQGSTFAFDIRFEGLDAVELGALLWVIHPDDIFYHKLGAAKPFGYGSVTLEIDNEVTRIESAADVRRCWLAEEPVPPELPDFVQEYKDVLISATNVTKFESHPTIAAFLQYGAGLHGVVRYPGANGRNEPGFKWFVENERGPRHSLPEIGGTLPDL